MRVKYKPKAVGHEQKIDLFLGLLSTIGDN